MEQIAEFPHEMGLLLGYPVEDVEGFIENKGHNYLYAGYWKVYGHVEEKKALFNRYEEARKVFDTAACKWTQCERDGCLLCLIFIYRLACTNFIN